ncbi:TetR/AcrR family transcriptional regulator [Streptomyces sp. NRRL S-340]|uniref:TetR/AcrR family transcriptional regulator n=1 Tax=Streptomyces sp. NRRL S-340 TaxID=1463901 RepID=UPI0005665DA1|nr:TetR/AcrR family transcriptional regulator [Streptomyces sp. NRRL S-340]
MTGETRASHRERSKARRREAIRRAGMRLFAEQGYEGTTIADIAEAADVAPRTVSLYFPSKHDIALSVPDEIAARLTAVFRDRPDSGFLDVVDTWLRGEADALDPEVVALLTAMYEANPALRAHGSSQITEAVRITGPALAAATGLPGDHPVNAVVGAAVGAALSQYFATILQNEDAAGTHRLFMDCLHALVDAARRGAPGV